MLGRAQFPRMMTCRSSRLRFLQNLSNLRIAGLDDGSPAGIDRLISIGAWICIRPYGCGNRLTGEYRSGESGAEPPETAGVLFTHAVNNGFGCKRQGAQAVDDNARQSCQLGDVFVYVNGVAVS